MLLYRLMQLVIGAALARCSYLEQWWMSYYQNQWWKLIHFLLM